MELDRGPYGTPLLNACAFGRLPMVKYLVRAGAKIISTKAGKPLSAIEAARNFPNIIQWLLVERYTDQPQIGFDLENGNQELRAWSGLECVEVEIDGLYTPVSYASSFDHAKELANLRRRLQGEVVNVFDYRQAEGSLSGEAIIEGSQNESHLRQVLDSPSLSHTPFNLVAVSKREAAQARLIYERDSQSSNLENSAV